MYEGVEPPPTAAPAGWYPDPHLVNTQRYWDGRQWTEHRAPSAHDQRGPSPDAFHAATNGLPGSNGVRRNENHFSHLSVFFGAIAVLFFPVVFGPVAIVLSAVAFSRKEPRAPIGLAVGILGLLLGMFIGVLVWSL